MLSNVTAAFVVLMLVSDTKLTAPTYRCDPELEITPTYIVLVPLIVSVLLDPVNETVSLDESPSTTLPVTARLYAPETESLNVTVVPDSVTFA